MQNQPSLNHESCRPIIIILVLMDYRSKKLIVENEPSSLRLVGRSRIIHKALWAALGRGQERSQLLMLERVASWMRVKLIRGDRK